MSFIIKLISVIRDNDVSLKWKVALWNLSSNQSSVLHAVSSFLPQDGVSLPSCAKNHTGTGPGQNQVEKCFLYPFFSTLYSNVHTYFNKCLTFAESQMRVYLQLICSCQMLADLIKIRPIADFLLKLSASNFFQIKKYLHPKK